MKLEPKMNPKSEANYRKHVGSVFGKLTILELIYDVTESGRSRYKYKVRCNCSNKTEKEIPCWYILKGNTRSCGCLKYKTKIDYSLNIGKKFGKVIILDLVRTKRNSDVYERLYYKLKCTCDIGTEWYYQVHCFHNDNIQSCGCKQSADTVNFYKSWIGKKINELTIVEYIHSPEEKSSYHRHTFICNCSCGRSYSTYCYKLLSGTVINCSKCYNFQSRQSKSEIEQFCMDNSLELLTEFKRKAEPVINVNGNISTIYVDHEFKCLTCGTIFTKKFSPSSTILCPTCNNVNLPSISEKLFHQFLIDYNVGYVRKYIKSKLNIQNYLEIDFLIDNRIGIELNGLISHATTEYEYENSFIGRKPKSYHLNKTISCEEQGIDLMQFWNTEFIQKPDIVKSIVLNRLGKTPYRGFARKCAVKEINKIEYNLFMNSNHIQGTTTNDSVRLGLYYIDNNNLVSVMSFGKSRFKSKCEWEMFRFANLIYTNVVGSASKLFTYFLKKYNPNSIVSYSDRRVFNNGKLYETLGFKHSHNSDPSYWYFKRHGSDTSMKLYHRSSFMKHDLDIKLENYDPNLTEFQNMEHHNYFKVFDCGTKVYEWYKNV